MTPEVSEWLQPMLEELLRRDDCEVFLDLMDRASMPVSEALIDEPEVAGMEVQMLTSAITLRSIDAGRVPEGQAIAESFTRAVDWVRLGQLLRDHLGWFDYPIRPEAS